MSTAKSDTSVVFVVDRNTTDAKKRMWRGYGVQFDEEFYLVVKDHKTKVAKKVNRAQVFTDLKAASRALKGQKMYTVHHDGRLRCTSGFVGSDDQFYEFTFWGLNQLSRGFMTRKEALPYARKKARSTLAMHRRLVRCYERLLAKLQK